MKNYRDTHTDVEYKNFLDDIAFKPITSKSTKHEFLNKKYFDYLPTDEMKSLSTSDDKKNEFDDELVELQPPPLSPETEHKPIKQRENHRRFRRNGKCIYFVC